MLDLFISMITGVLAGSVGFYGGYKLGHINGRIKQMEIIDKEFNEAVANA